jgi:FdhD protein
VNVQARRLWQVTDEQTRELDDTLLVEEPLEIRIAGDPLVVTMRTPGDDPALTLGFLFGEGIISSLADVGSIVHCGRLGEQGYGNVVDVAPGPGVVLDPERIASSRRESTITSSCGVCGRQAVEDLLERVSRLEPGPLMPRARLFELPARLRAHQPAFSRTGGAHAAAAFDAEGNALAWAEDVGRHNAVDKVIGRLLLSEALDKSEQAASLLFVSGRTSFEIVQKALNARIGFVAGVSAPSSLAVSLAERAGITLAGFVREGRANLYTHPGRLAPAAPQRGAPGGNEDGGVHARGELP